VLLSTGLLDPKTDTFFRFIIPLYVQLEEYTAQGE